MHALVKEGQTADSPAIRRTWSAELVSTVNDLLFGHVPRVQSGRHYKTRFFVVTQPAFLTLDTAVSPTSYSNFSLAMLTSFLFLEQSSLRFCYIEIVFVVYYCRCCFYLNAGRG